jgi:hypothetical protein
MWLILSPALFSTNIQLILPYFAFTYCEYIQRNIRPAYHAIVFYVGIIYRHIRHNSF